MTANELAVEMRDLEQAAIAGADAEYHRIHGRPDDWSPLEEVAFVRLVERVHRIFNPVIEAA